MTACMNHPDRPADLKLAQYGPPLCPEECATSAELPDLPANLTNPAGEPIEVAQLIRRVQRHRRALTDIAKAAGLRAPERHSAREIAKRVSHVIADLARHANDWEEIAAYETERRIVAEHRFDQVTGRQGNEIGQLRKALTHTQGTPRPDGPDQSEVIDWLCHSIGQQPTVTEQTLVLAEEVGELCRAVVKRAQGIRGSHEQWSAEVRAELADTQIVLLALAECEGVDLAAATAQRWALLAHRDATAARRPNAA